MDILTIGYQDVIRSKFGVSIYDLSDDEITNSRVDMLAEAIVKKRIPDYEDIVDEAEILFLEDAVINYICYLLCPSMSRRLDTEVRTLDTSWKKDRVDWTKAAQDFLAKYEESLSNIDSVEVETVSVSLVDKITNDYLPIGS